jgi:hypothetical protein
LITCNNIPIDDIFAKEAKLSGDYMVVDIVVLFPSDYIAGNRVLRILISSSYNLMRVKSYLVSVTVLWLLLRFHMAGMTIN